MPCAGRGRWVTFPRLTCTRTRTSSPPPPLPPLSLILSFSYSCFCSLALYILVHLSVDRQIISLLPSLTAGCVGGRKGRSRERAECRGMGAGIGWVDGCGGGGGGTRGAQTRMDRRDGPKKIEENGEKNSIPSSRGRRGGGGEGSNRVVKETARFHYLNAHKFSIN